MENKPIYKPYIILTEKVEGDGRFVQQLFEVGKQPKDAYAVLPTEKYIDGRINWETKEYYEGATQAEQDAYAEEEALKSAEAFMAQKEEEGLKFFKSIDLKITVALSAIDRAVLFPKLAEIDSLLYPPLNKIKTGDFASALYLFVNQSAPQDSFVLSFYNEALNYCQTYYDTNYPK